MSSKEDALRRWNLHVEEGRTPSIIYYSGKQYGWLVGLKDKHES